MIKLCLIFLCLLAAIVSVWDNEEEAVLYGEHCQYIDFADARSSGAGCVDGTKMVIKNK